MKYNKKDLIGKKFGKLTVVDTKIENHKTKCTCVCDCGNKSEVYSANLKNGHTKSCGCYQKEKALNNIKYLTAHKNKNFVNRTNLDKIKTVSQNQKNNVSGVKGVFWHSQSQKWTAKLNFKGKSYQKRFVSKEEAIKYRKSLEEKYFKPIIDKYKWNVGARIN